MRRHILLLTALVAMSGTAMAGTVMESRDAGGVSTITIEGNHVRIDTADDGGRYSLIDLKTARFYLVDPGSREIYDGGALAASRVTAPAGMRLNEVGAGEAIAGYATRVYRLEVKGKVCGSYSLASKPLKNSDIRRFSEFFVHHNMPEAAAGLESMESPCQRAQRAVEGHLLGMGVPLKTVHDGGQVSEIVSIRGGVKVPAERFVLPRGFKRVDLAAQMRSAQQMQGKAPQLSPEQRKMIQQQMQDQLKQMTPEQRKMIEQMMQQQ